MFYVYLTCIKILQKVSQDIDEFNSLSKSLNNEKKKND